MEITAREITIPAIFVSARGVWIDLRRYKTPYQQWCLLNLRHVTIALAKTLGKTPADKLVQTLPFTLAFAAFLPHLRLNRKLILSFP